MPVSDFGSSMNGMSILALNGIRIKMGLAQVVQFHGLKVVFAFTRMTRSATALELLSFLHYTMPKFIALVSRYSRDTSVGLSPGVYRVVSTNMGKVMSASF